MNFTLDTLDGDIRGTAQSLMPPSAKNMELLHGFTYEPPRNPGQTYRMQTGEHVTAPGDGKVTAAKRKPNAFRHSAGLLDTDATWQVTIYHGFNVYSTIQGMSSVTVQVGTPVVAGRDIGTPLTGEIFFQVLYHETPYDPSTISRFFRAYDGGKVPGKRGYMRQGTDQIERPAEDVQVVVEGDIRYFVDVYCRKEPILLNIDFAGTGAKSGFAAIGSYGTDYWNVYTHSALTTTEGTLCLQVLPDAQSSTGTAALYSGTLVECLHTGTTSGTLGLYSGTLVECLHTGTSTSDVAIVSGTLVEGDPWLSFTGSTLWMTTGTVANVTVYAIGTDYSSPTGLSPYPEYSESTLWMVTGTISPPP